MPTTCRYPSDIYQLGYGSYLSRLMSTPLLVTIAKSIATGCIMLTTGNQLKAARALGGVEQIALAEAAGVSVGTIRNMEAQGAATLKSSLAIIKSVQSALEARGIEFLNHGEPGVKLRKAPPANG